MSLFKSGIYRLHSGTPSDWKIDCDSLTEEDLTTLSHLIYKMVGPFRSVEGVPSGGLRLAKALQEFADVGPVKKNLHLIVDDVLTTGGSMEAARLPHMGQGPAGRLGIIGAVVFARGPCPSWVKPLFQMPTELLINAS